MKLFPLCCLVLPLLAACAHSGAPAGRLTGNAGQGETKVIGREGVEGRILGSLAPSGRFARLQIGMSRIEVEKLAGRPDSVDIHTSGLVAVPHFSGLEAWSIASHYPGEGRLIFNADQRLVLIDARESAR